MSLAESGDQGHGNDVGHRRRQPDRDLPGQRRFDVRGAGSDFLQFRADSHRVFQNVAALFRQHHAAPMPRDELDPQFFLEHADLAAQRRLSDPQSVGGLTQAAELGDMDQGAELAEFHWDRIGAYLITKKSLRTSKPV